MTERKRTIKTPPKPRPDTVPLSKIKGAVKIAPPKRKEKACKRRECPICCAEIEKIVKEG